MRSLSLGALVVSLVLIPLAVGVAVTDHNRHASETERHLASEADQHAGSLDAYFLRARSAVLLTAHDAAYRERNLRGGIRRGAHRPARGGQPRRSSRISSTTASPAASRLRLDSTFGRS